jgi:hypothetical protein
MQIRLKISKILLGAQEEQGQIGLITYKLSTKRVEKERQPDSLAMVTLTLNEDRYISEWIDFHHALGARHFYIYDQNEESKTHEILRRQIDSGFVTVVPWPNIWGISSQTLAYAHAISSFWRNYRWMALTDIDEFVFPVQGFSITDSLLELEAFSAVFLKWRCFGPNGHITSPNDYVIRSYTQMAKNPEDKLLAHDLTRIKAIIDPSRCVEVRTHGCIVEGKTIVSPTNLILNHYITRSEEDFMRKIQSSSPWMWGSVYENWKSKRVQQFEYLKNNWVEDRKILRVDPFH